MSYLRTVALPALLLAGAVSYGQEITDPLTDVTPKSDLPLFVEELTTRLKPSVVVVMVPNRDGSDEHLGSGFAVGENLIATNLHVVGEGREIVVKTLDNVERKVTEVYAFDRASDLAILRVISDSPLPALPLADSDKVQDGSMALAIGNPLGLKFSVVSGVISAKRVMDGRQMLQLAMPIEPGNSGGPVIDANGRVQGVVTMKSLVSRNLGFAVSINTLKPLLEKPNSIPMSRWLTIGKLDSQRWEPVFGARWHQRGGRILVDGKGEGFGGRSLCISTQDIPKPPYECAVAVKLDDESGAAGIIFDCDDHQRHYGFYPSAGNLRLSRFDGPTVYSWNVLREVPSESYRPGEWNRLRVRVETERILCFVNGELVIESTDRELKPGRIGLAKFRDTVAQFKGFQIGNDLTETQLTNEQQRDLSKRVIELSTKAKIELTDVEQLSETPKVSTRLVLAEAEKLEKQAKEFRRIAEDIRTFATCRELGAFIRENDGDFDLLKAALLIAKLDEEDIEIETYTRQVDRMAEEIQETLPNDADVETRIERLNDYLFKQNGFHGNRFDYYHRGNSYINRVIDDRVGLPITISVLYMELGKRLGVRIEGVGLPGHFVVKWFHDDDENFVDVFEGGKAMSEADVKTSVRSFVGRPLDESSLEEITKQYSESASKKSIVVRLLSNLRGLAERDGETARLLRYLEALVAIDPDSIEYRGLRSLVRMQSGRRDAAIADLDWFLENKPAGLDLNRIRQMREQFVR